MTFISFLIGLCIGILGTCFLYSRKLRYSQKDVDNMESCYEQAIIDLKNEVYSYKDIVKSLNKDIENLNKSKDNDSK